MIESILSTDSAEKTKFMTATEVASQFGIPRKTLLNRSNLNPTDRQYIPSVKMGNGRKKYFERIVIAKLLN
jgi:hypothetical protein